MDYQQNSVFKDNDKYANKVMTSVMTVSFGVLVLVWLLLESRFLVIDNGIPRAWLALCTGLMLVAIAISIRVDYDRPWLKYLLMGVLIVAYGALDGVFTYYAAVLIVFPVVMSSRYFSKKYTLVVAAVTYVTFFISAIWGANYGILDLNFLELPQGTVIEMENETWLSSAVQNIVHDRGVMIRNALCYSYAFRLLLSLITAVASVHVAEQGRKMVLKQQALTQETASVEAELSVASKIQKDMLPGVFPAFPDREEFDLYASMTPALMVGGDFYDFFLVDDDHLAMVMADVSDKGIPAAMFMVHSKNTISNNVLQGKSPAKALIDANNILCDNNSENMFVTVWLGVLEISTGMLTACNAGHEPPFLRRSGGRFKVLKDNHGFAMGCISDAEYEDYEIMLKPKDVLFLYTDGVPEATNDELKLMGMDRVLDALNKEPDAKPKKMIENVRAGIDAFVSQAEQFDDITMLALQYSGK